MKKLQYTKQRFERDLLDIARQLAQDNWKPDIIIGPARGGLIPAVLLSHYYDVKMLPINLSLRDFKTDIEKVRIEIQDISNYKNILVVDDIVDSGETLDLLKKILKKQVTEDQKNIWDKEPDIRFAALYYNISNAAGFDPEYYVNEINKEDPDQNIWVVFPFENWWAQQ